MVRGSKILLSRNFIEFIDTDGSDADFHRPRSAMEELCTEDAQSLQSRMQHPLCSAIFAELYFNTSWRESQNSLVFFALNADFFYLTSLFLHTMQKMNFASPLFSTGWMSASTFSLLYVIQMDDILFVASIGCAWSTTFYTCNFWIWKYDLLYSSKITLYYLFHHFRSYCTCIQPVLMCHSKIQ